MWVTCSLKDFIERLLASNVTMNHTTAMCNTFGFKKGNNIYPLSRKWDHFEKVLSPILSENMGSDNAKQTLKTYKVVCAHEMNNINKIL